MAAVTAAIRGQCRRCGREFIVRADGMIRMHQQQQIRFRDGRTVSGPTCPGSGKLPAVPAIVCSGTRARLSGWKIASDGSGNAICPDCAKPDPVTVGLCRDLERSVGR